MFELIYVKNWVWHAMCLKVGQRWLVGHVGNSCVQWMDEELVGSKSWSFTKSYFRHLSMTHIHIHLALAITVYPKRVSINIFINTIYEYNVADVHAQPTSQSIKYTNKNVLLAQHAIAKPTLHLLPSSILLFYTPLDVAVILNQRENSSHWINSVLQNMRAKCIIVGAKCKYLELLKYYSQVSLNVFILFIS